jgi:hypothetical protein
MRCSPLARTLVATGSLLGAVALLAAGASPTLGSCARHRPALTYRPGGADVGSGGARRLIPCRLNTGHLAMEPSFGFGRRGDIFFQTWGTSPNLPGGVPPVSGVLRSSNDGRTWKDVSPRVGGVRTHPLSFDPQLIVDPRTSRIYTVDWEGSGAPLCAALSYSDDNGRGWTTSPLACGGFDGESVAVGPPVTSHPIGYPNLVYYCTGTTLGSSPPLSTPECSKSLDGGLTFVPTGEPPFPLTGADDLFGPWAGNPIVGPHGTLYVPKRFAGGPELAISHNEGLSWRTTSVARNGSASEANRLAVDARGRLYYTWIAANHLPYLAVSANRGRSWKRPIPLAPRGVRQASLPVVNVTPRGKVAAAYVATTDAPLRAPDYEPCNVLLSECTDGPYAHTTWSGYLTQVNRSRTATPVLHTALVNRRAAPLFKGGCAGEGQCKAVLDFLDVEFDGRGDPWAAYVDECALRRNFQPVFNASAGRCEDGVGEGFLSHLASRAR